MRKLKFILVIERGLEKWTFFTELTQVRGIVRCHNLDRQRVELKKYKLKTSIYKGHLLI